MEGQKMNRITRLFANKNRRVLNLYFTAGYPQMDDTLRIAETLESAGADMLEIGIPYSDPIADGPTIQASSAQAIANGMTLQRLFGQLAGLRDRVGIPVLLMGYLNPVLQFGVEEFCAQCAKVGVDGIILPDLPMDEYQELFKPLFEHYGLHHIFLVTPQTSEARIRRIDRSTKGFIYLVSSASITGSRRGISEEQVRYFERVHAMELEAHTLIGFGISDQAGFDTACRYASGAIIGSALIRQLSEDASDEAIRQFVKNIIK